MTNRELLGVFFAVAIARDVPVRERVGIILFMLGVLVHGQR